jgi:hypothetical protein
LSSIANCATRRDDVLHQEHGTTVRLPAFGEAARPIGLGLLADEERREPCQMAEEGRQWHSAKFQATQHVDLGRYQVSHPAYDSFAEHRIRLEEILIEVRVDDLPGAHGELSGETTLRVDVSSQLDEISISHHGVDLPIHLEYRLARFGMSGSLRASVLSAPRMRRPLLASADGEVALIIDDAAPVHGVVEVTNDD